jgi:hypothetical protein
MSYWWHVFGELSIKTRVNFREVKTMHSFVTSFATTEIVTEEQASESRQDHVNSWDT